MVAVLGLRQVYSLLFEIIKITKVLILYLFEWMEWFMGNELPLQWFIDYLSRCKVKTLAVIKGLHIVARFFNHNRVYVLLLG